MTENELNARDMVNLINKHGGDIKNSGFSHWMNDPPRNRPNHANTVALEIILNGKIKFISE